MEEVLIGLSVLRLLKMLPKVLLS